MEDCLSLTEDTLVSLGFKPFHKKKFLDRCAFLKDSLGVPGGSGTENRSNAPVVKPVVVVAAAKPQAHVSPVVATAVLPPPPPGFSHPLASVPASSSFGSYGPPPQPAPHRTVAQKAPVEVSVVLPPKTAVPQKTPVAKREVSPTFLAPPKTTFELCNDCDAENLVGFRFCQNCGKPAKPVTPRCKSCNAVNLPDFRFCSACGNAAAAAASVVVAAPSDHALMHAQAQEAARRAAAEAEAQRRAEKEEEEQRIEALRRLEEQKRLEERRKAEERRRMEAEMLEKQVLQEKLKYEALLEEKRLAEERRRQEEEAEREAEEEYQRREQERSEKLRRDEEAHRLREHHARKLEEAKRNRKTLVEIQREEEEEKRRKELAERPAQPSVPVKWGSAKESFVEITVAKKKNSASKSKGPAAVVASVAPSSSAGRTGAQKSSLQQDLEDVEDKLDALTMTARVHEETDRKRVNDMASVVALKMRRAQQKAARLEAKEGLEEKLFLLFFFFFLLCFHSASAKSLSKAKSARDELFTVELTKCKHSVGAAVSCRLCETDKERKNRIHRRIKRDEVLAHEEEARHLAAQKRLEAERDAVNSMLLTAKKRNKHLGGVKHRVCESWRHTGECSLYGKKFAARHK